MEIAHITLQGYSVWVVCSLLGARLERALSVVVPSLAVWIAAYGQSPLTVEEAVRIGLQRNPQVAAGRAGVDAALAGYHSISILPPVMLGATHVQGTSTAPTLNGTNNDTFIDLSETLDMSGQRRYQAAGAHATYEATRLQLDETLLSLEQQIRDAYWSLAAAQAQTRIADVSLQEAKRIYELTAKQELAGSAPRGDVIRSSIDVANSKQTFIAAKGTEKSALVAFNTLLDRNPIEPAALAVDLAANDAAPPLIQVPNREELARNALRDRPSLQAATQQSRAANFGVRQAESARLPDLSIDYQRSTTQRIDTLLVAVSLPLLDFGTLNASIRAAKATRKQAEAQELLTERQVLQQVAQAVSDLENAIEAAASYKREILDPSVTLLAMAQLGYQQGATGILPVIDAESTIRNARVGYINALLAVYKAQDELLAATGRPSGPVGGSK